MSKCDVCGEKISTTFLNKIIGTYVKFDKKIKAICSECQSKFTISEIKEKTK